MSGQKIAKFATTPASRLHRAAVARDAPEQERGHALPSRLQRVAAAWEVPEIDDENPAARKAPRVEDVGQPPWVQHAEAMGVDMSDAAPAPRCLRPYVATHTPASPRTRSRSRSRTRSRSRGMSDATPATPRLRPYVATHTPASPRTRSRSRGRLPDSFRGAAVAKPAHEWSPLVPLTYHTRETSHITPVANRGWDSERHVLIAIALAGMPPPYTLVDMSQGMRRYRGSSVVVNFWATKMSVLVQGRDAVRWDRQLRAAQEAARRQ